MYLCTRTSCPRCGAPRMWRAPGTPSARQRARCLRASLTRTAPRPRTAFSPAATPRSASRPRPAARWRHPEGRQGFRVVQRRSAQHMLLTSSCSPALGMASPRPAAATGLRKALGLCRWAPLVVEAWGGYGARQAELALMAFRRVGQTGMDAELRRNCFGIHTSGVPCCHRRAHSKPCGMLPCSVAWLSPLQQRL